MTQRKSGKHGMRPVGFWKGAGIPKGRRVTTFVECGCCGAYHRTDFTGDCREDSERFDDLPDGAVLAAVE
jgi:hypothetical protein